MRTVLRLIVICAGCIFGLIASIQEVQAAVTINSVSLDGAASVTVLPGATISVVMSVDTDFTDWRSTGWRVSSTPGGTTCVDHTNHNGNFQTYAETLNVTAPLTEGTYNAYFVASSNNTCTGTTTALTVNAGVIVVQPPTVLSADRVGTSPSADSSVQWTIVFSENVSGVSAAKFALVQSGGLGGAAITSVTGGPTVYAVTASTGTGSGNLGLNVVDDDTILDSAGNPLGGAGVGNGSFSGQVYAILHPAVSSINRASNNPTTANSTVTWNVVFNASVSGVDAADFMLVETGGAAGASIASVAGSGTTWAVTANTGTSSTGLLGLNLIDNDSISRPLNTPLGGVGAGNGNFTGQVYTLMPPVVTLGKTASASAAAVDSYVTFNITASNPFDGDLNNVVVTDVIPAGIEYSAHAATSGTATVSGQTLSWTIPTLPAGTTAQLTLVVKLVQKGTFTNTATSPGAASASASILVLSSSYVHYRMDAVAGSWAGATGEVFDSGKNGLHGRRRTTSTPTTTNTVVPTPTIDSQHSEVVGGFCNAGGFDSRAVVESASSSFFQFKTALSASAWIYPTAYPSSDLYSILSNDTNYEFHLNPAGKLYWWWQASTLTSAATIPLNQWTHVAVTLDSTSANRRQRIYINGVQDANTNNWTGTLAANACPFYIGGDINTGSGCALSTGRNFRGMIDEVKIYDYELNAAEVEADMTLGRLCSGTFDHVRIEHDGSASTCSPKTVTLKACLDASCTALYQGDVTVKLTPSGWVGGDTVTIKNGVATATLGNASIAAPSLTLGTADIGPAPAHGTRCFNGAAETCSLSVVATSCSFDAVEPGASPQTHLFTKRAGVAFNVDLLALSTSTSINTAYTGTVTAEVVDTSSVACPNGTVLSSAQATVGFSAGNQGRKAASFTVPTATASAQVRIKAGTSPYACSYDKFAVRPSAATLSTSNANAAAPNSAAAPTVRAGAAFNIAAATAPTGYTGNFSLDSAKLQAQLPTNDASVQGGGAVGALVLSPALKANTVQGNNATYAEVGYLYATPGAFRDTSFTSVDQIGQLAGCAATDTCDCLLSSNETSSGVPNYLSDVLINGRYGCYVGNKATYSFGRFIPDHFDTATTQACVAGAFTYSGQPFPLTVTANSAAGGGTANYTGKFAKPVNLSARDAGDTADNPGPGVLANTVIPAAGFTAGVANATPTYTFNDARTAPTNVRIRAIEPEVSSLRAAPAVTVEGTAAVRSGRARLGSAYGSELLDLPVLFRTEFWNGTGWVLNAADSCTGDTTLGAANAVGVTLAPSPAALPTCIRDTGNPGLSGANACIAVVPARQFREGATPSIGFAGEFNLWLAAPGANNPGWTTVTATVPAWLGGVLTTRATFGSYKTPLIYRRETY